MGPSATVSSGVGGAELSCFCAAAPSVGVLFKDLWSSISISGL